MKKEKYIEMRKTGQYDLTWFYQYYVQNIKRSKNNNILPFPIFSQIFSIFLQNYPKEIFNNIDKEFEVSYIENEKGGIIYMK